MFGMFQDPKSKLEKKYQQLLAEAHRLSHVDRKKSDLKSAEAEEVRKAIETLENSKSPQ